MNRQDLNGCIAEILGESKRYVECRSRGLLHLREICQSEHATLGDGILLLLVCTLETTIGGNSLGSIVLGLEGLTGEDRPFLDILRRAMMTPEPQDWGQTKLILDKDLRFADLFLCEENCPPRRYHFGQGVPDVSRRVHIGGTVFRKLRKAFS